MLEIVKNYAKPVFFDIKKKTTTHNPNNRKDTIVSSSYSLTSKSIHDLNSSTFKNIKLYPSFLLFIFFEEGKWGKGRGVTI